MLFWAVDEGILLANPLSRLRLERERKKKRPVLSLEEEARLLAAAAPHLRPILIAALDSGMRRGEILQQRWEDVDFNRNLLFVTRSKTPEGEAREIPLTARFRQLLEATQQPSSTVFAFEGRPIRQVKTAWKAALRRSGIRILRLHDLRHTFNTRLMEAGVMQEVRKSVMGHSSGEDINATYTHVELPAKREAIRKLEVWVQSQLEKKGDSNDGANGLVHQSGGKSVNKPASESRISDSGSLGGLPSARADGGRETPRSHRTISRGESSCRTRRV